MVVQTPPVTTTEFEQLLMLPGNSERRLELVRGKIVEKVPTELHAFIAHFIHGFLFMFLREHPIGRALIEARYQLPHDKDNSVNPDISFVAGTERPIVTVGPLAFMPDLAIEIQSPGQSDKFMAEKAKYYLANGSRMVWLVYSTKRLIEVLTPTDRHLLTEHNMLDGREALPGFTLRVGEVFPA